MTINEVLKLPTDRLESLTDKQLDELLGPLIPAARQGDKQAADKRDLDQLLKQAAALLKK